MTYDAVVFDLDGTLTDSAPGILACARYALEKMGKPIPSDAILRKFLGPPLAQSFMMFCGLSAQEALAATHYYRERYHDTGWLENRPFPGIRQLLLALRQAGIRLSVATGKPQDASEKILDHFRLSHLFERIVGPAPDDYQANKRDLILRSLEGFKGRAVMVGDRDSDVAGARQAGIDCIAVSYGYGSEEEFIQTPPALIASSPSDLCDMLGVPRPSPRGFFISFEGNDGCGKSTQVKWLAERLAGCGFKVQTTREPGGSDIAERIRGLLLDPQNMGIRDMTEAYLYAAARAQHVREIILPALRAGKILITDRYVDSSVAYQGAGRSLGMALVSGLNAPAIDGCLPDLTILLDIDAQQAMMRRQQASQADRIEMQDDAFHARVEQAFHQLALENSKRIVRVDALGEREEVAGRVESVTFDRLKAAGLL
ncbi:MAG: dTMP kinase [Christensenellales bacterium]